MKGVTHVRFMVMLKGEPPRGDLRPAVARYNEELVKAGVLLAAEELEPPANGARVSRRTVVDGPFHEHRDQIAGYWLWQMKSLAEAIEWVKRYPHPEAVIEIRPVLEIH